MGESTIQPSKQKLDSVEVPARKGLATESTPQGTTEEKGAFYQDRLTPHGGPSQAPSVSSQYPTLSQPLPKENSSPISDSVRVILLEFIKAIDDAIDKLKEQIRNEFDPKRNGVNDLFAEILDLLESVRVGKLSMKDIYEDIQIRSKQIIAIQEKAQNDFKELEKLIKKRDEIMNELKGLPQEDKTSKRAENENSVAKDIDSERLTNINM